MEKYTLKVKVLDSSVTVADLRMAVENVLLRLHPRITYHFGAIAPLDPDYMLVEIVSEAKKDLLESHLRAIESKLSVSVEKLGWGWIVDTPSRPKGERSYQQDPLVAIEPKTVPCSFLLEKKALWLRSLLILVLTIVLTVLLIVRIYLEWLSILCVYYVVFIVWLFSLSEMPLNLRLFVNKVACEPSELVVTYLFGKRIIRMNWETIWGLEDKNGVCVIYHGTDKPTRFLIGAGFHDKNTLLKTIVHKASLYHVETGIGWMMYKRYEAP